MLASRENKRLTVLFICALFCPIAGMILGAVLAIKQQLSRRCLGMVIGNVAMFVIELIMAIIVTNNCAALVHHIFLVVLALLNFLACILVLQAGR